jgi:NAD(P)-dependent dehydrogenase (short-subunit alcohol dehydrogenase family)
MGEARRALVTGTSTGIGRAIALELGRQGFDLAVTELDLNSLDELLKHPDLQGRKVIPVRLDLRDQAGIEEAFDRALDGLGDIDLLVNNAGRALHKPVVDVTWAEWDDVMNTNLKGSFFLSQRFGRACIARRRPGCIVSLASTHGVIGIANRSVYGISKAGVAHMTKMLAIEWAEHGIRVNAVAPGRLDTLSPSRAATLSDPSYMQAMLQRIPLHRLATAEEVAAAVCYLAGPGAASVTGHTLVLDGGLISA